ncbi:hypothetical protein AM1_4985 [Acaryochloris marina MBIC11017]|uniref:Uncharacterized protein n=1 Tax=Acaryochloris marina (strain MBIC 11017) TaxID=329726 RepID=B0C5U1_ACAM1|nr:hypothetical protein AM1_4985 [Acaryochloris marina MBIC11017]
MPVLTSFSGSSYFQLMIHIHAKLRRNAEKSQPKKFDIPVF